MVLPISLEKNPFGGKRNSWRELRMNLNTVETRFEDGGAPDNPYKDVKLRLFFGCKTCPHIGNEACVDIQRSGYDGAAVPVEMIQRGKAHANKICKGRYIEIIEYFKLMGKPDGLRLIRNKNMVRVQEYTNFLYNRLMQLKAASDGSLTKEEKDLMWASHNMNMELNRRLESSLKQDEGTKVEVTKLTPSQINELINEGLEKKKTIEASARVELMEGGKDEENSN